MAQIRLTKENCARELSGTALMEFQAPWCTYCRRIAPAVRMISEEWGDALRILEIDIDEMPELALRYGVEAVPSFVFLRDGAPGEAMVAPDSKSALDAFVRRGMA